MDTLKPPTDNLYKFLAITGIVLVAFCLYTKRQARKDLLVRVEAFRREETENTENLFLSKAQPIPLMPPVRSLEQPANLPTGDFLLGNAHERLVWEAFLASEQKVAVANSSFPSNDEMVEYFKRPEAIDYFVNIKLVPKDEYDKFVQGVTMVRFIEMTAGEREFLLAKRRGFQRLYQAVRPVWDAIDDYESLSAHCDEGWKWGLGLTVFGFSLWWWKYQRYQDRLILAETEKAIGGKCSTKTWLFIVGLWHKWQRRHEIKDPTLNSWRRAYR